MREKLKAFWSWLKGVLDEDYKDSSKSVTSEASKIKDNTSKIENAYKTGDWNSWLRETGRATKGVSATRLTGEATRADRATRLTGGATRQTGGTGRGR